MTLSNVKVIRPTPILRYFSDQSLSTGFNCSIPDGQIGSTNMLERLMLVIFSRLIEAENIFEFGTYRGETTELFITNNCCTKLVSLDIPYLDGSNKINSDEYDLSIDWQNDKFLTMIRKKEVDQRIIKQASKYDTELALLKCDSLKFDNTNYLSDIDLIFVDGGHTMDLVKSDSDNAFSMLSSKGIILWHDYGSTVHSEVTEFIDELSTQREIFSIGDTGLAFYTNDTILTRGIGL